MMLILVLGWPGAGVVAQDETPVRSQQLVQQSTTLAQLAADADVIAVARVHQTEYAKTRSFPSSGWALLKVLVAYRGTARGELLQVTEKGLGDRRCYYPELGIWQFEGDRFLVFLKKADADSWQGTAPGCRLPVLVDQDNQFALRYPIKGLHIEDPSVVQDIQFKDPAARVDASDFTKARTQELEDYYLARRVVSDDPLAPPDVVYEYTRGIRLPDVRRLMNNNQ